MAKTSTTFQKGDGRKKGRKKGVPNRTTTLLKDAILKAAQEAGGGGNEGTVKYLQQQARENPGPFLSLLGKVLPTQLANEDGETLTIKVEAPWLDGRGR